jgi:ERCC4-related helicase
MTLEHDEFSPGSQVRSQGLGIGIVLLDQGQSVVVQFENGIDSVLKSDLQHVVSFAEAINLPTWPAPIEVLTRIQAESIQSVNDTWGVFSQSRIALLPHQLWVCRKVNETWPTRWMVADDVGLGKTIEAGLILLPLIARSRIKRLLILCPASLVDQWQFRLREMFDIRLTKYTTELDTARSDYWNSHSQVVASLQTLRIDQGDRQNRLLAAEPWDMVMVDEAHHLNADVRTGPTLGYQFVSKLLKANKAESVVFFTGTPHRGKNFGFWSLMNLLRPDLFSPDTPPAHQTQNLREAMIRNNKQNVTNLKGERLFEPPIVSSQTYDYSQIEKDFYEMLTDFISTGKAYASGLSAADQRLAMLVLITMQKLASSSIAAVRRAIDRRLKRIVNEREAHARDIRALEAEAKEYSEVEDAADLDRLSTLEELLAEIPSSHRLMEDEEPRLVELLESASQISEETKIQKIIAVVNSEFQNQSVLMFTEYKATQSLMMSELIRRFGDDSVTFINGEGRAENVVSEAGVARTLSEDRSHAAAMFNAGKVRFLISTEAAGEGIDLQESCHTLVHIDLPWNPMRLHQRVGRLNRYGQKEQVKVLQFHNPSTVESRIWDLLNTKIETIMAALNQAMDDPEDLMELVLGMSSPSLFREVFSEAGSVEQERLDDWFDQKTSTFGGRDAVETVNDIVGNASRFDYQQVSSRLPRLDLPDLSTFLRSMLAINRRRVTQNETGIAFQTPVEWKSTLGIKRAYDGLIFDRNSRTENTAQRVLGVGHKVIDAAIHQAKNSESSVTSLPASILPCPLIIFRIFDQVTIDSGIIRSVIAGVTSPLDKNDEPLLLSDESLLVQCNEILAGSINRLQSPPGIPKNSANIEAAVSQAKQFLEKRYDALDVPFKVPTVSLLAVLWLDQ